MNKIVVDTNVIFSAILNVKSVLSKILIEGGLVVRFYAPSFLNEEITLHQRRICELKKFDTDDFSRAYSLVTQHITFIHSSIVTKKDFEIATKLCESVDINDVEFVALTSYLNGKLWTGDQRLISGLKAKNWHETFTTSELLAYLDTIGE